MTLESNLLDRIHAINGTIPTNYPSLNLTVYRFFSGANAKVPCLFPLLRPSEGRNAIGTWQGGDSVDVSENRTIDLVCAVASPRTDKPLETAQKHAEAIIEPILSTYYQLPYLRYDNEDFSQCADTITVGNDTGIVFNEQTGLIEVRIPIIVPVMRSF